MGKTTEQIEADIRRPKYFSPSEAVEYGIIDKVPLPSTVLLESNRKKRKREKALLVYGLGKHVINLGPLYC